MGYGTVNVGYPFDVKKHNADPDAHPAAISKHNLDPAAHPYILGVLRDLQAQVDLLNLQYNTDVNANPFIITFATLDGVDMQGVWNQPQARVEF